MSVVASNAISNINPNGNSRRGSTSQTEDFVEANYWLNVGYCKDVELEDGTTIQEFVGMPRGIPLDTTKPLKTNSSNDRYYFRAMAQNDLWQQVLTEAQTLEEGEEKLIQHEEFPFVIQLYRRKPQREEKRNDNPYLQKFSFGRKAA